MIKLYIGNLPYQITKQELTNLFSNYGIVESCNIIIDKITGKCKGFAFVEMPNEDEAESAIKGTNGTIILGRAIKVNHSKNQNN